tara:strand:- start:779 stop:1012 length:234 start_codon:yes stop_codon:yes gene_type:complete
MIDARQLAANVTGWAKYVDGTEFEEGDTLLAVVATSYLGEPWSNCYHVVNIVEGGCEDSNGDPWGWELSDIDFYVKL